MLTLGFETSEEMSDIPRPRTPIIARFTRSLAAGVWPPETALFIITVAANADLTKWRLFMFLFLSFRQIRPQVRPQMKLVFLISQFEIASSSYEPEFNAWEEVCKELLKNSGINFQNRHLLPSSPLISGTLSTAGAMRAEVNIERTLTIMAK
jgi:hypothetical protein